MRELDITNWRLMSTRATSENYTSPDGAEFLKVFTALTDEQIADLHEEQRVARAISAMAVPTPHVGDVVAICRNGAPDGRMGLLFQNIPDKTSLGRAIAADPESLEEHMGELAEMARRLHATPCDTEVFEPFTAHILAHLDIPGLLTEDEKTSIRRFIAGLPPATTCCHGDFHFGNVITSPQGKFFIDLGFFGYGDPRFDVAHLYGMCLAPTDDVFEHVFHLDRATSLECWRVFACHYAGIPSPSELADFERDLAPFAYLDYFAFAPQMPGACTAIREMKSLFDSWW